MKIKLYKETFYPFDDGTNIMCTTFDSLEALDEFLHPFIERMLCNFILPDAVGVVSNWLTAKLNDNTKFIDLDIDYDGESTYEKLISINPQLLQRIDGPQP